VNFAVTGSGFGSSPTLNIQWPNPEGSSYSTTCSGSACDGEIDGTATVPPDAVGQAIATVSASWVGAASLEVPGMSLTWWRCQRSRFSDNVWCRYWRRARPLAESSPCLLHPPAAVVPSAYTRRATLPKETIRRSTQSTSSIRRIRTPKWRPLPAPWPKSR
jgi:hypothetical protein